MHIRTSRWYLINFKGDNYTALENLSRKSNMRLKVQGQECFGNSFAYQPYSHWQAKCSATLTVGSRNSLTDVDVTSTRLCLTYNDFGKSRSSDQCI